MQAKSFFRSLILFLIFANSACTVSISDKSIKGKIFGEASFEVLSNNILIDGVSINPGSKIKLKAGTNTISFDGQIIRKEIVGQQKSEQEQPQLNGIACVLLLPWCIASAITTSPEPIIKHIKSRCSLQLTINTEAGHTYTVYTNDNVSNAALLVVDRKTSPSFNLAEEIMDCHDVETEK